MKTADLILGFILSQHSASEKVVRRLCVTWNESCFVTNPRKIIITLQWAERREVLVLHSPTSLFWFNLKPFINLKFSHRRLSKGNSDLVFTTVLNDPITGGQFYAHQFTPGSKKQINSYINGTKDTMFLFSFFFNTNKEISSCSMFTEFTIRPK